MTTYTGRFSGTVHHGPRGTRMCECPLCRELFTGEATFVAHRVPGGRVGGVPAARMLGPCQDPATVGLTLDARGVWGRPGTGPETRTRPGNPALGAGAGRDRTEEEQWRS